eukprot:360210-Chlamydomonas_euryale.AAC.19
MQRQAAGTHAEADCRHSYGTPRVVVCSAIRPLGPAVATICRAALNALGYTPAWTLRMHTASGTLTNDEPAAATPPATNATWPAGIAGA